MKKAILFAAVFLGSLLFKATYAQNHVGIQVNIGVQPVWGPVGYDYVDYYYMPDIDVYYYVPRRQYIYMQQGRWRFSASLPARYRDYDLYRGYKVVVNEPSPYLHDRFYREKYSRYKGNHSQEVIRNSHDSRYFVNRDHPQHNEWNRENKGKRKNNGNGNGNGSNHGNGNGNGNEKNHGHGNGHNN